MADYARRIIEILSLMSFMHVGCMMNHCCPREECLAPPKIASTLDRSTVWHASFHAKGVVSDVMWCVVFASYAQYNISHARCQCWTLVKHVLVQTFVLNASYSLHALTVKQELEIGGVYQACYD